MGPNGAPGGPPWPPPPSKGPATRCLLLVLFRNIFVYLNFLDKTHLFVSKIVKWVGGE